MHNPLVRAGVFWLLVLMQLVAAVGSAIALYAMRILSYNWSVVFGAVALLALFYLAYNLYKKWFN